MSFLDILYTRRSVRKYSPQPLTADQREAIVKAALLSPSACNRQPWHVTVVEDGPLRKEMEDQMEAYFKKHPEQAPSQEWIDRSGGRVAYDAPAIFVISTTGANRLADVGIVAQSICLAAKAQGLSSVILGMPRVLFYPGSPWPERLAFPEGYEFGLAVAVGQGTYTPSPRQPDVSKVTYL